MSNIKKSINQLGALLISILLWLTMSFNRMNPDWNNYQNIYLDQDDFGRRINELGFFWITRIGRVLNIDYSLFYTLITSICLLLIILLVFKMTKKPLLPILFYGMYPFMLDIVQLRNFIAMTIILWALYCLFNRKKDSSYRWLSLSLILLAGTIHNTAFVYIGIWLAVHFKEKYVALFSLVGSIGVILFLKGFDFDLLTDHLILSRYVYLFRGIISPIGQVFFILNAVLLLGLVQWITRVITATSNLKSKTIVMQPDYFKDLRKIAWMHFALIPLFIMSVDFYRIMRNCLLLFYILFSDYILFKWQPIKYKYEKWAATLVVLIFIMSNIYVLLWFSNYDNVVRVIPRENLILKYLINL